jgi:arabinose-5-phosphate isomerase
MIDASVETIMRKIGSFPMLPSDALMKEALDEMNIHAIGIVCIVDAESKLIGIITDGDLRRRLLKTQKPFSAIFNEDVINFSEENMQSINSDTSIKDAANIFLSNKVWDLPVISESNQLLGIVHLHEIVESLIN